MAFSLSKVTTLDPSAVTGTGGAAYLTLCPQTFAGEQCYTLDAADASGNYPITSGADKTIGTISSLFSDYRAVSAGVNFTPIEAADAPRGYLQLCEVADVRDVWDSAAHADTNFSHDAIASTLHDGDQLTYIFDLGEKSMWHSELMSASIATDLFNGAGPALVALAKSADNTTTSGKYWVEIVIHYEGVLDFGDTISTSLDQGRSIVDKNVLAFRSSGGYAGPVPSGKTDSYIMANARLFGRYLLDSGVNAAVSALSGKPVSASSMNSISSYIGGSTNYPLLGNGNYIPMVD